MIKILFIFSIIFSSAAVFSQVPSQQQMQPGINALNKQIADLENQIADAIQNGKSVDLGKMISELEVLKGQLNAIKQFQKNPVSGPTQKTTIPCVLVWTGSLVLIEKVAGKFMTREKHIDLTFNQNVQTSDVGGKFTDIGSGTVKDHASGFNQDCNCQGVGDAKLTVVGIDESKKIYWIGAEAPLCKGGDNGGACGGDCYCIGVDDQPLVDKMFLTGTQTVTRKIAPEETAEITTIWNLKRYCPPWDDPYSDKRIATLDPKKMKDPTYKFVKRVEDELCIKLRVAQAFRTVKEQDELYALGRTKPGNIVTNAKGNKSYHTSGKAIDVYMVNCDGTIDLNNRVPDGVVKIAKEEGLDWGGDWTKKGKNGKVFKDYPHFEIK